MGDSSEDIRDDDVVADVVGLFTELLATTRSAADAAKLVESECADYIADADDGPLFWIGLAEAQWTFGRVEPRVVARVKADFESDRGLERWRELSDRAYARRRAVLTEFIAKIGTPNPRPKKAPKLVRRAPIFEAGDCLSIRLEVTKPPLNVSPELATYMRLAAGRWAAAFVLIADSSSPYVGRNLVATIDWIGDAPPGLDVFHARKWLHERRQGSDVLDVRWYDDTDFKGQDRRIERVGNLPLRSGDEELCVDAYATDARLLRNMGEPYSQERWERLGTKVPIRKEWERLHPPGPAEVVDGWVFCRTCRSAHEMKGEPALHCPHCDRDLYVVS